MYTQAYLFVILSFKVLKLWQLKPLYCEDGHNRHYLSISLFKIEFLTILVVYVFNKVFFQVRFYTWSSIGSYAYTKTKKN